MGFSVEGEYFEACSCEISCPCIWLQPATEEDCDVFFAWHITGGNADGVDLAGLNVALAVHTSKQMTDGNWTVSLYLDEKGSPEQVDALGKIFSGQSGGHLANLAPLIGTVAGINTVPIVFESQNGSRSVSVGEVLQASVSELKGGDGQSPAVITNAPLGAVTQPLRQGRSDSLRYDGHSSFTTEGRNAFLTEFRYNG
jgi:hypothetical protein